VWDAKGAVQIRRLSRPGAVALAACLAAGGLTSGFALALSSGASGNRSATAADLFGVFRSGDPAAPEAELAHMEQDVGVTSSDRAQRRILGTDLGQFHSRLVAVPARGGENVCFALLGRTVYQPAASYCYRPRGAGQPAALAGERFSVMGLWGLMDDGRGGTQVFGVAEDSVKSMRVMVAGAWRDLPIARNGFYLDLPGVPHDQAGLVEAILQDGTKQLHDIQTGS
jgi:hypothetical protein